MKLSPRTRKRSIVLILIMAVTITSSAFAIVWMQQQISRTARNAKHLEAELAEMVRRIGFLDERIAAIHQPVVLQGKVAGTLRPSMDDQVVWVREQHLATGRAYAVAQPYEVSVDLAMLEMNLPRVQARNAQRTTTN
jgi:hypothetical protein